MPKDWMKNLKSAEVLNALSDKPNVQTSIKKKSRREEKNKQTSEKIAEIKENQKQVDIAKYALKNMGYGDVKITNKSLSNDVDVFSCKIDQADCSRCSEANNQKKM